MIVDDFDRRRRLLTGAAVRASYAYTHISRVTVGRGNSSAATPL